jgi:hypothetical protein
MHSVKKQAGMTILGWLLIILGAATTAVLAMRLIPHYIDYRTVITVVDALPQSQVHKMSKGSIRDNLKKRFRINNVRSLDYKEIIRIERDRSKTLLVVDYEVREAAVGNADIVLRFNETFEYD